MTRLALVLLFFASPLTFARADEVPAPAPAVIGTAGAIAESTPEPEPEPSPTPDEEPPDPTPTPPEKAPVIRGGIYDKPSFGALGGRTALGGYADIQFRYVRADGLDEELTAKAERFNLFTFSPVSDRVRVAAEIEIEEMGEEITLETAIVDFEIHEALVLRAGVILSPLGRFNLAHDSPANDLVERPLVSTEILAATLSEPGGGVWGVAYPYAQSRISWEAYLVNGFDERVITVSPDGTRIAEGKGASEDANQYPSTVARVALSPIPRYEVGISAHRGPYNVWSLEGETIDERRDLTLAAIDFEASGADWAVFGEAAHAWIDVPPGVAGLLADEQQGWYLEARYRFLRGVIPALPASFWTAAIRLERVDFDVDRRGDDVERVTFGVSFRPTPETAFKLDLGHTESRDRFVQPSAASSVIGGVATYF